MNREELAGWAAREWIKQAGRNTPMSKSIRNGKAQDRALRREYLKEKRSLASRHSARMRLLKRKQAGREAALREKRGGGQDREFEERRLNFIMGFLSGSG